MIDKNRATALSSCPIFFLSKVFLWNQKFTSFYKEIKSLFIMDFTDEFLDIISKLNARKIVHILLS